MNGMAIGGMRFDAGRLYLFAILNCSREEHTRNYEMEGIESRENNGMVCMYISASKEEKGFDSLVLSGHHVDER